MIRYPAVGVRFGINPAQTLRNVNTANVRFDNVTINVNQILGNGPGVDIGYLFWWYCTNCGFSGNSAEGLTTDKRAAILADAGGTVNGGLWDFEKCLFSQAGIIYKVSPASSWGNVGLRQVSMEGSSGLPVPTLFRIQDANNYGSSVLVDNAGVSDAQIGAYTVEVVPEVGVQLDPGIVVVTGSHPTSGPLTSLGSTSGGQLETKSPVAHRGTGFWGRGRVAAQHDSSRRGFAPSVVRFTNLCDQNAANWGSKTGAATVTTGIAAPDGSTNAGRFSSGSGLLDRWLYSGSVAWAVGDWVVAGTWMRGTSTTMAQGPLIATAGATKPTFDTNTEYFALDPPILGAGDWFWVYGAHKVTAILGTSDLLFAARASPTTQTDLYAPFMCRIPTGTLSDSEVLEWAQHLQSYPDGAPVGHVSTLKGQKLITHGGLGVGNSATATTSVGSLVKKVEIFDAAGASLGFVPVYATIS
jgi:hypothetical protein